MTLNIFTGARCRFTIDGTVVAFARNAMAAEEWQHEPVKVLGSIEALGHEPVDYTATLRASALMPVNQTLEALGFAPKKGQTPQDHLRNILLLPDLVCQIEDDISETVVARVFGVRLSGKDFTVDRGVVPTELSFVATRILGASEIL